MPRNSVHATDVGKFGNHALGPVMEPYNQPLDVDESATFYVKPIASEWLSRSAVVLLKSPSTPEIVLKASEQANFPDVVVKSLGGHSMILTFTSKEVRNLALTDSTLIDWFISLKPWNGESASLSRFVWLKCRGMPLQSWNVNTFKRIGDYCGVFINTDAETAFEQSYDIGRILISTDYQERIEEWINLVVNGKLYKVKIWEEECDDPFNIIFKGKENTGVQTGLSLGEPANPKGVTSGKLPLVTSELDMDGIEKSEEDNGATHNEGVVEKIDDLEDGNDEMILLVTW
ncbi:hypothetical protein Vadar_010477 [Vaccinium darrowii]|uniref:Uncharacterized protein n=1 Tax=Vaccinium darrowii TaxID=229202 RepID=A0ACB7XYY2_9ERIC|nr:hypothetical protein Vadar_010477 [Vaccinium darrowii]